MKRSYRKKRRVRRKRYSRRRKSGFSKRVRAVVNSYKETKVTDDITTETTVGTLAGYHFNDAFCSIDQINETLGTGVSNNRISNRVYSKSIYFKIVLYNNASLNINVRMALISPRAWNDRTYTTNAVELLDNNSTPVDVGSTTDTGKMMLPYNYKRFRVHWGKIVQLQSNGSSDSRRSMVLSGFVRTRKRLYFNPSPSGDFCQNPYVLVFFTGRADGDTTDNNAQIEVSTFIRHRWCDL